MAVKCHGMTAYQQVLNVCRVYNVTNSFKSLVRFMSTAPGVNLKKNLHSLPGCQSVIESFIRSFAFSKGTELSGDFFHMKM